MLCLYHLNGPSASKRRGGPSSVKLLDFARWKKAEDQEDLGEKKQNQGLVRAVSLLLNSSREKKKGRKGGRVATPHCSNPSWKKIERSGKIADPVRKGQLRAENLPLVPPAMRVCMYRGKRKRGR